MAKEKKQKQVKAPPRVITKPLNVLESPWMPEYVREEKTIWPLTAKVGIPENTPYIVELTPKEGVTVQAEQPAPAPVSPPAPVPAPTFEAPAPAPTPEVAPAPAFEEPAPTPVPEVAPEVQPASFEPAPAEVPSAASPGIPESTYLDVAPTEAPPAVPAEANFGQEASAMPEVTPAPTPSFESAPTPDFESTPEPAQEIVSAEPVESTPEPAFTSEAPASDSPADNFAPPEGTQSILERLRAKCEAPDAPPAPEAASPEFANPDVAPEPAASITPDVTPGYAPAPNPAQEVPAPEGYAPAPETPAQEGYAQEGYAQASPGPVVDAPPAPVASTPQAPSFLEGRTSLDLSEELSRAEMERSQIFEPKFVHKNNGDLPAGNVVVVGRAAGQVDYAISDNPKVSSVHLKLSKEGSNWFVTDLGSTNGTRVNGMKIEANAPKQLKFGDSINFSGETITFEDGSQ